MSVIVTKNKIFLFVTVMMSCCLSGQAAPGFFHINANRFGIIAHNDQTICHPIPAFMDPENKRVNLAYTQKVKDSNLASAIPNANKIVNQMTSHLSEKAMQGINKVKVVLYHCNPALPHGMTSLAISEQYDHLSMLGNPVKCFSPNNRKANGQSWDSSSGGAIGQKAIRRDRNGRLFCTQHPQGSPEFCGITAVCDANLVSMDVPHVVANPGANILVHEFGHTVMDAGLPNGTQEEQQRYHEIAKIYQNFFQRPKLCNRSKKVYACTTDAEMWAVATQTWFHSTCPMTIRKNVNTGIATPEEIKKHLPRLYKILTATYGPQSEIHKIPVFDDPNCQKRRNSKGMRANAAENADADGGE